MVYLINGFIINNVPDYAIQEVANGYSIVARYVDDEFWFYGVYPTNQAYEIALMINGKVFSKL